MSNFTSVQNISAEFTILDYTKMTNLINFKFLENVHSSPTQIHKFVIFVQPKYKKFQIDFFTLVEFTIISIYDMFLIFF